MLQLYVEMIDTMAEIEIAWERYADEISNFLSSMLKNFLFRNLTRSVRPSVSPSVVRHTFGVPFSQSV